LAGLCSEVGFAGANALDARLRLRYGDALK
jgi:hypothetical protein